MPRKKTGNGRQMFCRRLPVALIERLRRYASHLVPRTSDTEVLERAITEFLDRHEPKPKGDQP